MRGEILNGKSYSYNKSETLAGRDKMSAHRW